MLTADMVVDAPSSAGWTGTDEHRGVAHLTAQVLEWKAMGSGPRSEGYQLSSLGDTNPPP